MISEGMEIIDSLKFTKYDKGNLAKIAYVVRKHFNFAT